VSDVFDGVRYSIAFTPGALVAYPYQVPSRRRADHMTFCAGAHR